MEILFFDLFNHNDQMLCNCPIYLQHQFVCPETDDTELDVESFTSIISKIDEEQVASKPVLASTSASFKTPTKRSAP